MKTSLTALLLLSGLAWAETPAPGPSQPPQRGVKVFDDGVFILSSDKKEPTTTKSTTTGAERPLAGQADYNTEQRDQWLETCSPLQESNPKGYRDCYKNEKKKTLDANKRRLNSVNEREKSGFRTADPIPDSAPRGNPIMPEVQINKD